jgi:hypothetical protein
VLSVVIRKIVVALIASCAGPICRDRDGHPRDRGDEPCGPGRTPFPAPLVALGSIALPIGVLLLVVQAFVVAYEVVAGCALGNRLWGIGVAGGLTVGLAWHRVLASSATALWMPWALGGLGVFQAAVAFCCHWLASGGALHGVRGPKGRSVVT